MTSARERPQPGYTPPQTFDEYRLVALLGTGAMGQVYLAHDTVLDRSVAIKFIRTDHDLRARELFLSEARAIARLHHPNVVGVFRTGDVDGRPYLVSEYVRGRALDALPKPVAPRQLVAIAVGLARGLAAAHRRNVLHRDLKPANAIVSEEGEVKLLDFGLAKVMAGGTPAYGVVAPPAAPARLAARVDESLSATWSIPPAADSARTHSDTGGQSSGATAEGALIGTPLYMAPEAWRGEAATVRSDLYSLGAVLYELAAGRPPHDAPHLAELMLAVRDEDARPLAEAAEVDPRLAAVVDRCLRRDPAARFPSADAVLEALEALVVDGPAPPIPEGNPYRGLSAFQAPDRGLFFGRSADARALLERLRSEQLVLVTGDSGVGKSSLCRAAVLPVLEEERDASGAPRWAIATVVPAGHPLQALRAALAATLHVAEAELRGEVRAVVGTVRRALVSPHRGLVLFVDQLEELVTVASPREAAATVELLRALAGALGDVRILGSVRADCLVRVATLPGMFSELSRAIHLLSPLTVDQMREAVLGPARRKGVAFESEAMVEALVEAGGRSGGALPLLQFALAELWEGRDRERGILSAAALEAIGGVAGALARHADAVLDRLSPVEAQAARRALVRLVSAEGTRMRRGLDELGGDRATEVALEALTRARLLVAHEAGGGARYEVAHEALIGGWPRLQRWLAEDAEARTRRDRVERATEEWERLGRHAEALWKDRQLLELEGSSARDLGARERAFVAASLRASRRRRWTRRASVLAAPFVVALAYGAVSLRTHRELAVRVDVALDEGRRKLASARAAVTRWDTLRREAFARFDAPDVKAGELRWAEALEAGEAAAAELRDAGQALEAAVAIDRTRSDVRALLADALYERALFADAARRTAERDELLARLATYDDGGARRARVEAPAHVKVDLPPAATMTVERYERDGRDRLVPRRIEPRARPGELTLEPGSYRLAIEQKGRPIVYLPLVVSRDERRTVEIAPPQRTPAGFVYVPRGRFLFGTPADEPIRAVLGTVPMHPVETGDYFIAKHETTYADWIAFLETQSNADQAKRAPNITLGGLQGSVSLRRRPDRRWQLTLQPDNRHHYVVLGGENLTYPSGLSQDWLRLPVSGVSFADGRAYAAWLARSGRVPGARLCTELEWERAARGADDREFPHGDRLHPHDANYLPEEGFLSDGPHAVGSHAASRSPFGVDDLAGNVYEWATSSLGGRPSVLRGGPYAQTEFMQRVTVRGPSEPGLKDIGLGLRICAAAR